MLQSDVMTLCLYILFNGCFGLSVMAGAEIVLLLQLQTLNTHTIDLSPT